MNFTMNYTQSQWLMFYFTYCFIGWVWESCYVSVRKKRWVNRGFLFGPALPIYGFGAIVILFATLSVRESIILTYLLGMIGATALEYVSGAISESIFHVRYWDYSNNPLNIKGYICLYCSLGWGLFSVLLVRIVHPPIEKAVLLIPENILQITTLILVIIHVIDFTKSVQSAFDLKKILSGLSESNRVIAAIETNLEEFSQTVSLNSERLKSQLQEINEEIKNAKILSVEKLQQQREKKSNHISLLSKKAELLLTKINQQIESEDLFENKEILSKLKANIESVQDKLRGLKSAMNSRMDKQFSSSISILKRNPGVVSKVYNEGLKELKDLAAKKEK